MKKLNLLKLFILITTTITSLTISAQSHQRTANIVNETSAPYYAIFNLEETFDLCDNNLDVTLVYPCNKIDYQVKCNALSTSNKIKIDVSTDGGKNYTKQTEHGNIKNTSWSSFNTQIATNVNNVAFLKTGGTSIDMNIRQIKFTIAPHLILTSEVIDFGNVEFNGGNKNMNIEFQSFYNANGELKITGNTNPDVFRITTTKIADQGKLKKVNTSDYAVQVSFYPNTVGEHTSTVTISDGQFTKTVTLKGVGTKKAQKITWKNTKQICIGETLINPAYALNNATITYSSSNPEIIAIEGNILRPLTEGKATITATIEETDTHFGATSTKEFESTNKTLQTISWEQDFYNLRLGGNNITLNATASSQMDVTYTSDNENVIKIEGNILSIIGEGQTYIHATQAGNETYAAITESKFVYVRNSNACANYALAKPDKVSKSGGFDWSAITVTHTLTAPGDKLSFNATCNGASTGKALRVYDDLGNNYVNSTSIGNHSNIQIDKKAKTLTFVLEANLNRSISNIYVTQATYLEATKDKVTFESTEISSTASTSIGVSYSNFNDIITIALKNGTNFSIDKTFINCQCGQYGTENVKITLDAKEVGNICDTLVVTCGDYTFETPIKAEIIKHYQSISWTEDLVALNPTQGATYELNATASSNLPVYYTSSNENIVRIENNKFIVVGAGEVTITAKQDGNLNYEPATPVSKTITIAKLDQTISWNQEFAADLTIGNIIELSAVASSGDVVAFSSSNEAVATISGNVLTIVGIGETTITASQAGNNNYNAATEVTKSLSIAKLNQTITWNQDLAGLMIGNTETLNATASSGLEITYSSDNDAVASINGSTITVNSDGTVTITATQAGNDTYNATSIEKTFTFGRTAQTITWNDDLSALKINDVITLTATSDAGLEITYTIDNSAVATIEGNTLTIIGAGEANITAQQAGNDTYNSASVIKTINIEHLTQTIDWKQDLSTLTLESETIELNAVATSGLDIVYSSSNTAVATIEGNTLTIVGAGETTITARQAGNNQYTPAEITQTLNISKLSQTIVWEQNLNDITLLENFFELTAEATSGLIVTYTSSNEAVAQVNGNILSIIGEGEAIITAIQSGNEKYDAAVAIEKTITITKQSQEIIWDQDFSDLDLEDYPYELTAYATSGLPVIYELDNLSYGEKAIIEDNYLYPYLGNCSITIYAHQQGNEIYKAAQTIEKTVYINTTKLDPTNIDNNTTTTMIYTDNIVYFNGEHNTLRVFDMTGRMIYSANVEDENSHYLPISQRGIYVICLDNQSLKIVK